MDLDKSRAGGGQIFSSFKCEFQPETVSDIIREGTQRKEGEPVGIFQNLNL